MKKGKRHSTTVLFSSPHLYFTSHITNNPPLQPLCSIKRKVVCTSLRYLTHVTNSCLVFASTKEKNARDNVSFCGMTASFFFF